MIFLFPLLARKSTEKKGKHASKRMDMCCDLRKDGGTTCSLYALLSLPLVSELERC